MARARIEVHPVTPDRWDDLVTLFGAKGACGGCWCMTPRLARSEYERAKGAGNRRRLKRLVDHGERPPGLLGYRKGEPVAWVSVEPREAFGSLARSRVCAPVDDRPVWSIVCLVVRKDARGQGVSISMIRGAVDWARDQGATCIEASPQEPRAGLIPAVFAYTGVASAFTRAGFREVARRSPTRPIMRRELRPRRRGAHRT